MEKLVMEFDINEMSVTDVSELCDLLSKGDIAFEMEKVDHAGDMGGRLVESYCNNLVCRGYDAGSSGGL